MTQTPQDWLMDFFSKRCLERANGCALYKYRTNDTEFANLKNILKTYEQNWLWNKLFVLYAAEWWRQNYEKGTWAWSPIFESLNIEKPIFGKQKKIIEEGLKSWGRQVYRVNGRNGFLTTIVIESGLPIKTVAKDTGWLKNTLRESFCIYYQKRQRNHDIACDVVKLQTNRYSMPPSLQKEEFYNLLIEIIERLAELKDRHPLADEAYPVEFLDKKDKNWRDDFPLSIDTPEGRTFINTLLKNIATAPAPAPYPFQACRVLKETPQGWELHAEIKLDGEIEIESVESLKHHKQNLLSRMQVSVETSSGAKEHITQAYTTTYKNQNVLSISNASLSLFGQNATDAINLCLYAKEPIILPMTKSDGLEDDLPWVFVEKNEEWDYIGQASQRVSSDVALVVVKDDLSPSLLGDGDIEDVGEVLGRRVYKISGSVLFQNDEEKFRIRTGATDIKGEEYVLQGTHPAFASKPSWVSIGQPDLLLRDTKTHFARPAKGTLEAKARGTDAGWRSLDDIHQGRVSLRFTDEEGYIVFRRHIAILPPDFKISLDANASTPNQGNIIVKGAGAFSANITDTAIHCTATQSTGQIKFALQGKEAMPPECVSLCLRHDSGADITFTLPFPSNGIRVFNTKNQPLSKENLICADHLHGIRIHLFNGQDGRIGTYQLNMKLCDDDLNNTSSVYFDETMDCAVTHYEIPLNNYAKRVSELLSVSKNLDAFVRISMSLPKTQIIELDIHRYPATIKQDSQPGCVALGEKQGSDDLKKTTVLACLVNKPDQPIELTALTSNEVHRASWDFLSSVRKDGDWIIYPDKTAAIQFRPLGWSAGESGTIENPNTLQKCLCISDEAGRMVAIKQVIAIMVTDFTHSGWNYIKTLWQTLGHLPLPTFDIWKAFVDTPHGLVALLCKGEEALLNKLSQQLPVMWEMIPISVWQEVFLCYHSYVKTDLAKKSDILADLDIKKKDALEYKFTQKFNYIGKTLDMQNLEQTLKQCIGMSEEEQNMPDGSFLQTFLTARYSGAQGHSGLLTRHIIENDWPSVLYQEIETKFKNLPADLRTLIPQERDEPKPVAHLPIILAHESVMGNKGKPYDSVDVFNMKTLRNFDTKWFYSVFDRVQGFWQHQEEKGQK